MPNRVRSHGTEERLVLRTAIGEYPHTSALRDGRISSNLVTLDFADIPTINRAFAPMVREQRFDVSEMAIATFLQAKAFGKPLVLLPVVLAARSQHSALLCRADSDIRGPHDLAGRRVGVRAYSQTTGVWLRGMLADAFGIRPEQMRWVTFEDAHVAEYRDPPWTERAPPGKELLAMLRRGELDAVIVGTDIPDDPTLRTVFPDPETAAERFSHKHGFLPVNHLVTVRAEIARSRPDVIFELVRLFRDANAAAPPRRDSRDPYPCERKALEPAVELALRYAAEQGLLPHRLDAANVWEGLPTAFASAHPATTNPVLRRG
jgi:4,5-dihydroxyphthalate decarboxylase